MKAGIYLGDCMEIMSQMSDNSIDSIVTDPPYGLSFMGKKWDYDVPRVEIWKEALRVLKPGGHLLSFAGTRTQHRMAVNIEDAGFEIRDMIAWVYGSGFPKSHNISKGIDKMKGEKPIPVMVKEITDADLFNERSEKQVIGKKTAGMGSGKTFAFTDENNKEINITAPATPEAKQWEGWGTALKPALEPITVARKPLSEKTVAANVLKWGTGGINIDGCRIEGKAKKWSSPKGGIWNPSEDNGAKLEDNTQGRFPANFIHDGSQMVLDLFPETKSGYNLKHYGNKRDGKAESVMKDFEMRDGGFGDSGSAARFFYVAKASKRDRNEGLDGLEEKRSAASEFRPNHLEKSLKGEGGNPYGRWNPIKNNHPTVKPTKLMQYLVRLVTPPGGICLDLFMGSGSTGKACKLEGFDFIGIELDPGYFKIAEQRINLEKTKLQYQCDIN